MKSQQLIHGSMEWREFRWNHKCTCIKPQVLSIKTFLSRNDHAVEPVSQTINTHELIQYMRPRSQMLLICSEFVPTPSTLSVQSHLSRTMSSNLSAQKISRVSFASLTSNNLGTVRKLNSVLFPIKYSEKFYQGVLLPEVEDFCKLSEFFGFARQ